VPLRRIVSANPRPSREARPALSLKISRLNVFFAEFHAAKAPAQTMTAVPVPAKEFQISLAIPIC
jgi:hypothetical protein